MARAQHSVEQTFRQYTSIYNGVPREWFTKSEEALIDQLFATKVSVVAGYTRNEVQISQLKRLLQGFLQAGRKCEIVHFEFLDDHHIEYKTQITGPKGFESIDHSIARVDEDNKIVSMEPFCKYGTARILFQRKFREYFAMYDGSPKGFGKTEEDLFLNFFAKDFKVKIDGQKYNRQQWMEAVKTCIEGGMKVDILNFSFLPNSTKAFEYKIRVSNNDKDEGVVLHSVGRVKKGKFVSFKPYSDKAYQHIIPNHVHRALSENDGSGKENAMANTQKTKLKASQSWVPLGWERKGSGLI